jgi:DNA-binding NarL/FixJ family response regulator
VIRILIVDDHDLVREGIRALLEGDDQGFQMVA